MVGWHHRLNGHELGQSLGDDEGQGGLIWRHPWGPKESDMTWQLNNTNNNKSRLCGIRKKKKNWQIDQWNQYRAQKQIHVTQSTNR